MNASFWFGKKVFLTGHTGFKGSWLSLWLTTLGAEVYGYALPPASDPSLFHCLHLSKRIHSTLADIRDGQHVSQAMQQAQPDIVIHMAAQALVRYAYQHPVETYETNVMGTVHVLEAVRTCASVRAVLVVTSDKCYDNKEKTTGYREGDALGGHDPYSNSKGCAELVVSAYRNSFFSQQHKVAIASARAGNVIGGGDWSEDRLIPDLVRAFHQGTSINIRQPDAIRPWQHVFEALNGYLILLEHMYEQPTDYAQAWNFGPQDHDARSVQWLVEHFSPQWGTKHWHVTPDQHAPHETKLLMLDCHKARHHLHWQPVLALEEALQWISQWYHCYYEKGDVALLSLQQLEKFQQVARYDA